MNERQQALAFAEELGRGVRSAARDFVVAAILHGSFALDAMDAFSPGRRDAAALQELARFGQTTMSASSGQEEPFGSGR
jgi:hypothetical protein